MTRLVGVVVAMMAGLAAVLAWGAPAQAVDRVELRPGALERGADVRVPHLVGRTVVDGDVRVRVRGGERVTLLGRSGEAYVVGVTSKEGEGGVIKRVRPGAVRVLLRGVSPDEMVLSDDGRHLARTRSRTADRTRVTVYRAGDGAVVRQRAFGGSARVLDVDGDRMVIGSWGPRRTVRWNFARNAVATVVGRVGYAADISSDRLATYTRDPYNGGCSVVSRLARPGDTLWRSCRERVAAFSPRGTRMATIPLLSDGLGPNEVRLRGIGGRLVGHYTARWFDAILFESERALLLETNGARKAATVRCAASGCLRASALRPVRRY